jgi:hypothetical protein
VGGKEASTLDESPQGAVAHEGDEEEGVREVLSRYGDETEGDRDVPGVEGGGCDECYGEGRSEGGAAEEYVLALRVVREWLDGIHEGMEYISDRL